MKDMPMKLVLPRFIWAEGKAGDRILLVGKKKYTDEEWRGRLAVVQERLNEARDEYNRYVAELLHLLYE